MSVKDTTKQYGAIDTAPAPVTVPNDVSRNLPPGDRSFSDVVFESGKPVLDSELNLQQDAKAFAASLVSKHAQQSGFFRGQTRKDGYDDFYFGLPSDPEINDVNLFGMVRQEAIVAGFPIVIEFTGTAAVGKNLIQMEAPTAYDPLTPGTIKRTDFVFMEVWQALVAPSPLATGQIEVVNAAQIAPPDTITIGGNALTAVAGVPAVDQFQVDLLSADITATNIATAINDPANSFAGTVSAVAYGPFVRLVANPANFPGASGNAVGLALALTNPGCITVSAATLLNGADRPNKPSQNELYRHGNVNSDPATWLPDDLFDPTLKAETTQRVQVQYRIRTTGATEAVDYKVQPDGFSNPAVLAQGGAAVPVATYQFVPADGVTVKPLAAPGPGSRSSAPAYGVVDNGLYIAGDGTPQSATDLGSLDGYVYAIPIAFVFRHNESEGFGFGFDPVDNTNGAPSWDHAVYDNNLISPPSLLPVAVNESDRPDGHFSDVIDRDNLIDLRRHVNPMGVDLRAELQYQIQSLLDGKNYTWAIDTADKQELGNGSGDVSIRPLICDNIGREDAIDGSSDTQGNTPRGVTTRNFDHICRRFGTQPVNERVAVSFYPYDRNAGAAPNGGRVDGGGIAITGIGAASNPIVIQTAGHPYVVGDYVEIFGNGSDLDGKWVVAAVAGNNFSVTFNNTAGTILVAGNVTRVGVINLGKYVIKAAGGSVSRWHEDDTLVFDLRLFDATSDGGIFDGRPWASSGVGLANTNVAAFAPPGTVITNVLAAVHDDGLFFGPGIDQNVQIKTVTGLGTQRVEIKLDANTLVANSGLTTNNVVGSPTYNPSHTLISTAAGADPINGSERRIIVEFEVSYPRGPYGTTMTPTEIVQPNSTAVYSADTSGQRNNAVVENAPLSRPADMEDLFGAMYREGHREVMLEYEVNNGTPGVKVTDEILTSTLTDLYFPRRISGARSSVVVSDLSTVQPTVPAPAYTVLTVDTPNTPFGSSQRLVKLNITPPNPSPARAQTRCKIEYWSQDAIPNYGPTTAAYQLSVYYRANAPQTVGIHAGNFLNTLGGGQLPLILQVEPMVTSEILYAGQTGAGTVENSFPYSAPLDQIPINDGN